MKGTTSERGHETAERRKLFIAELKALLKRSRCPNRVPASRREQLLSILQHWLRYRPDPVYPGIAKMAKWAAASERTARVNVRVFESWGVLVPVAFREGGQGQAVHYLVDTRALFSALCRLGLKPSSFMRSFCDEYATHYPEVGGSFAMPFQSVSQRRATSDVGAAQSLSATPRKEEVYSSYPAVYPEGEGGFFAEKHTDREPQDHSEYFKAQSIAEPHEPGSAGPDYPAVYPEASAPSLRSPSGFLDGRPAEMAPRPIGGTPSQTPRSPLTVVPDREEERTEPPPLDTLAVASAAAEAQHIGPQESPFGRTASGWLRTWTGRPVQPDLWDQLSDWERYGSTGMVWNGVTRAWELCPAANRRAAHDELLPNSWTDFRVI